MIALPLGMEELCFNFIEFIFPYMDVFIDVHACIYLFIHMYMHKIHFV